MTELIYFLRFLKKRLYLLLLIPLVTMIAAYFLAKQLPDTYRSHGRIATGIVDKTDQIIASEKDEQDQEINRKFDNIIQLMRMKKVLDQVSYQLFLHDLAAPADSVFSPSPKALESLDQNARRQAINLIRKKHGSAEELSLWNSEEAIYYGMLQDLGYSHTDLLEKLTVYRLASSDYITVEFEAQNPDMSAFVINTLYEEFLKIYTNRLRESSDRSLQFLENVMLQKLAAMNERMEQLKQYKIQNKVLNLNEQARSLYGHIIDFETRREVARKDVIAYSAALKNIDNHFNPSERRYLESALTDINRQIAITKDQVRSANEEYIRKNFDETAKRKLDSLQNTLTGQISQATDAYIYNPMAAKGDLISHKLSLEISLELARNSIESIENEVSRLNRKYEGMVPNEASIQQFETSIDIAGKEYIEALQRYNNARLESYAPISLKLAEKAMPGILQPSKKLMLVVASGLAAFCLCLFSFFVIYFLDNAVRTPFQLANLTGLPVLGRLNRISAPETLLDSNRNVFSDKAGLRFRDLIRSVRYEIDENTHYPKIVAVTSLKPYAGKTTVIYGLARAYTLINRRVLIVDGNFSNPDISRTTGTTAFLEDFFARDNSVSLPEIQPGISLLGTQAGDTSLLELSDDRSIQEKLTLLKQHYDVILIETPDLSALNKAKEWIVFSDQVVVAFESGKSLTDSDKTALMYLRSRGSVVSGWILTGTPYEVDPIGKTLTRL